MRGYLISVYPKLHFSSYWAEEVNNEMIELSKSAGIEILNIDSIKNVIIKHINPKFYIGEGKLKTIKKDASKYNVDVFILNIDISASQQKSLSGYLGRKVITKTELIYEIFLTRAKSSISKIQIELANLRYLKSRLVGSYNNYDRIRGGIGIKGPGETKLEIDRRNLNKRITILKRKLKKYETHFNETIKKRKKFPIVSLVGYTNAGKTSLINCLTHSNEYSDNLMFSTVDTKSHRLYLGNSINIIITDTIGFIRDLPYNLIESFKTTLYEIKYSNLILIVVDINSKFYQENINIVNSTLKEISADNIPRIIVFNKIDKFKGDINSLKEIYEKAFFISAKTGEGIEKLKNYLKFYFTGIRINITNQKDYQYGE